jgi:hypothetical protein
VYEFVDEDEDKPEHIEQLLEEQSTLLITIMSILLNK